MNSRMVLLALVVVLALAAPVAADGLVIVARPAGEAGPQSDAAALSPQPRSSPAAPVALPAAGPLTRIQLWPWPPVQGQTLVVWLQATAPLTGQLAFAGGLYPISADGLAGWALVPIPALAPPITSPLTVTIGATIFVLPVPVAAGVFETEVIPPETSDPILSEAAKVQAELARMTALYAVDSALPWQPRARFHLPLEQDEPRTAPFGSRRTYGSSTALTFHTGEDFGASPGTAVRAPAVGVIVLAEPLFVRGNAVVLDHGHGVYTGYWHLQAITVKVGDRVAAGQALGEVGSTGLSTGPHLHWEMRVRGVAVDPLQWVEQDDE